MDSPLLTQQVNGIGTLILNRPQALNAINITLREQTLSQLRQWEKDKTIKAIVIKSSQEKAFCAGGDIRQIVGFIQAGEYEQAMDMFRHAYEAIKYVAYYPKPVLSIMNGITMGGGVGIGAFSSYRIITEHSVLAMPEVMIGLIPDAGSNFLFQQAGYMGLRIMLTGKRLRREEIIASGFADYEIPSTSLEVVLAQLEGDNIEEILSPFKKDCQFDSVLLQQIEEIYNASDVDSIINNLQKSSYAWAKKDLESLLNACPFALHLTYHSWHTKVDTLTAALQQDLMLVSHLIKRNDFSEGVRAVVIDKDRSPKWDRSSVQLAELKNCFTFA